MIKVLTKNAENNPEQEFVNSEPVQLMEKIEAQVIYRVTEINKHRNVPDNKVNKYEDTQRTNYMSQKRIQDQEAKSQQEKIKNELAMKKLIAPSIPREGKAGMMRSAPPVPPEVIKEVEIKEDEQNMMKYLGNLQQLLANINQ